jgi:diguanylate cyclase (GGDEF)-like protein
MTQKDAVERAGQAVKTLLLIEDNEVDRMRFFELAKTAGLDYKIHTVGTLGEAMAISDTTKFDVIVLDLGLPDVSQLEGLEAILANRPESAVLVMTGFDDQDTGARAVQQGADDYLIKNETTARLLAKTLLYITERHGLKRRLAAEAIRDAATQLYNRRGLLELGNHQLMISKREASPFAICFIDLDDLKKVNDSHGHTVGDRLIAEAAKLLNRVFRSSDLIARYGGDEFTVILPNTNEDVLERVRIRLERGVQAHNASSETRLPLSFSVGYRVFDPHQINRIEDAVDAADQLMYAAKAAKKTHLNRGMNTQ